MVAKRLYRSKKERMLGGVCAGIAEYFDVDPTLIRVVWVLITAFGIIPGILAYLVCWIIIPENPEKNE
ncbi:MAG: PspC domain-containing protein [Candidatus Altiarchaeota archaeon]|nr:PspC domain-containing protein [Candidatus Altiarchaeota archaeon]